jgi:hypothetical protein
MRFDWRWNLTPWSSFWWISRHRLVDSRGESGYLTVSSAPVPRQVQQRAPLSTCCRGR